MGSDQKHLNIESLAFHGVMELPWKSSFILLMRSKSISNIFTAYKSQFSTFLQENYCHIEGLTLLDPFRLENNLKLLEESLKVEGDIVECGCYKGGNAILMALKLKELGVKRKIVLFDSFEGLPEPSEVHDAGYKTGQFSASFEELKSNIIKLELEEYFDLQKGWFNSTVPAYISKNNDLKIALLHIDCDLFTSTMDCFPALFKKLSPNGIAIFDDFNDGGMGEKTAVLQTLSKNFDIYMGPAPQAYIYNKPAESSGIKDAEFNYVFSEILNNSPYLNWLQSKTNLDYNKILETTIAQKS